MSSSEEAISTNEECMEEEEVTEYQLTPIFSYVLYEHEIPDAPSIHDLVSSHDVRYIYKVSTSPSR